MRSGEKGGVFACEGKEAKAWEALAQALCEHNGDPRAITQASIGMSAAYIKGVKENSRNAEVVFNQFHVSHAACDAVDEVRRAESRLDEKKKEALKETNVVVEKESAEPKRARTSAHEANRPG